MDHVDETPQPTAGGSLSPAAIRSVGGEGGLCAMLAHELRNPLGALSYAVELLRREPARTPDEAWVREMLAEQAARLVQLVDDAQDFGRASRGRLRLTPEAASCAALVKAATRQVQPLLEEKRQRVATHVDAEVHASADFEWATKALARVLAHVARRAPEGETIRLDVECRGELVGIAVTETRAHDRTGRAGGMELALVEVVAELHGGRFETRAEGDGAVYEIGLPACKRPRRVRDAAAHAQP